MLRRNKRGQVIATTLCIVLLMSMAVGCGRDQNGKKEETKKNDIEKFATTESTEQEAISTEQEMESEKQITEQEPVLTQEEQIAEQVSNKLQEMTIEQKVGQLFMVAPEGLTGVSSVTAAGNTTRESVGRYPVGGIILFASNIIGPDQINEMTMNLQTYSQETVGLPMFIGVDEEGGRVARVASNSNFGVTAYPNMAEIGSSGDTTKAYEVGTTIGSYLKEYGFNLNFAPDADVLTNPENQVIGTRSFGVDPSLVADMDMQVVKGLEENGVYACLKHFPGHGATAGDTHAGYAYTDKSLEELMQSELVPFATGIENGISFIMVSHIAAPNVTGDNTPASVSQVMITDILRNQMGYDGIVITDSMAMGAITSNYDSATAAVKAIQAGVDIVLMPKDLATAYQGVLSAVSDGTLSQARIDEAVSRILAAKFKMTN